MKKYYFFPMIIFIMFLISAFAVKINSQVIYNYNHNKSIFNGNYGCYNAGIESSI